MTMEAHRASPEEKWRYGVEWRRTGSRWYTQKPAPHYPVPEGYKGLAPVYAAHRAEVTRRLGQPQAFRLAGDGKHVSQAIDASRHLTTDARAAKIAEARYRDWLETRKPFKPIKPERQVIS
jgi:hypothetical protein